MAEGPGYIAALHDELAGYNKTGRDDRAAQVVAELARLGVTVDRPQPRRQAEKRPASKKKPTR